MARTVFESLLRKIKASSDRRWTTVKGVCSLTSFTRLFDNGNRCESSWTHLCCGVVHVDGLQNSRPVVRHADLLSATLHASTVFGRERLFCTHMSGEHLVPTRVCAVQNKSVCVQNKTQAHPARGTQFASPRTRGSAWWTLCSLRQNALDSYGRSW